jgi:hypothetical protein
MAQRGNEIGQLRPGEHVIDELVDDILNERAHLLEALDLEIALGYPGALPWAPKRGSVRTVRTSS